MIPRSSCRGVGQKRGTRKQDAKMLLIEAEESNLLVYTLKWIQLIAIALNHLLN